MKIGGRFKMDRSELRRLGFLWVIAVGISLMPIGVARTAYAEARHVRWDIVVFASPSPGTVTVSAGGSLSATAVDGSQITLTGTGTFVQPASGKGTSSAVTGGGTWAITPASGTPTSGTYKVVGFLQYAEAPGTLAGSGVIDKIGDINDTHAGLGIFSILYSDGDRGVLLVSCNLGPATPSIIYEGASATKGFANYFAPVLPGDPNATLFHFED